MVTLSRILPGLQTLRHYKRRWLLSDLSAGLVLTTFLVPVGMGYAEAAGLPPITGLYATVLPLLAYALFGPSRVMVLGPDSSLAPVIGAILAPLAGGDVEHAVSLAGVLALLTGIVTGIAGLLRLGFVTELLSRPVQIGYLAAITILIFIGQTPKLLGIKGSGEGIVAQLTLLAREVGAGHINIHALGVGLASIAIIAVCKRWLPRVPGPFVAVVGGIVASMLLDMGAHGVKLVGALPRGFPAPRLPSATFTEILELASGAVGIALVAVADTTVLSQSLAAGRREEVEPNQELVALGAADVASGFFGGFPISSSASRTPVAIEAGAKTQLTGIVGAGSICALLVAGPTLLAPLPQPVLAAIVLVAASGLVDGRDVVNLYRRSRPELLMFLAAAVGVAFAGVIRGIFFAVLLSLGDFVRRAWRPHDAVLGRARHVKGYHDISRFEHARQIPGLLLYRFDAPLFFANARHFRRRLHDAVDRRRSEGGIRWVVLAAEPITDIDTTAAEVLDDIRKELATRSIDLAFAEMKDPVKDRLRRYGMFEAFGDRAFFPTVGTAVDAYLEATGVKWVDWEEEPPPAPNPPSQPA